MILKRIKFLTFLLLFFALSNCPAQEMIDISTDFACKNYQQVIVYFPDNFEMTNDSVDVLMHFLNDASEYVQFPQKNMILINIDMDCLSGYFQSFFKNQEQLQKLLNKSFEIIKNKTGRKDPVLRNLLISSFSAGYGGVREILKSPQNFKLVDGIVLADGLHADNNPQTMQRQMKHFAEFSKLALEKRKVFHITHSAIKTPYKSTSQTAAYLLNYLQKATNRSSKKDKLGLCALFFEEGFFSVKYYPKSDHMSHFYNIDQVINKAFLQIREMKKQ